MAAVLNRIGAAATESVSLRREVVYACLSPLVAPLLNGLEYKDKTHRSSRVETPQRGYLEDCLLDKSVFSQCMAPTFRNSELTSKVLYIYIYISGGPLGSHEHLCKALMP